MADRLTKSEFDELVTQYYPDLVRRATHLCKDYTVAEDAVQNTLLLAFEKLNQFEKRDEKAYNIQFRSWLFKMVAYMVAAMYSRGAGTMKPWQQKWAYASFIYPNERFLPFTPKVADNLKSVESDTDYIMDAIESLPKHSLHPITGRMVSTRYVEIAKMAFIDEMTSGEIGNLLGLAEGTIRVRLSRIRKILQSKMLR